MFPVDPPVATIVLDALKVRAETLCIGQELLYQKATGMVKLFMQGRDGDFLAEKKMRNNFEAVFCLVMRKQHLLISHGNSGCYPL